MITIEDIIGMTNLTVEEIDAVAEHECIPEACAAALADYLMHKPKGPEVVRQMISDDIRAALKRGNRDHAAECLCALKHFMAEHQAEL